MTERWFEGKWFFDHSYNSWCYLKPGSYVPGEMPSEEDYLHQISAEETRALIRELDDAGWIKPRLDERLRADDLKITHRLIDLLAKRGK